MKNLAILTHRNTRQLAVLSCSIVMLLLDGGCSNGNAIAPTTDLARAALEGALDSWKGGGKPGQIAGMEPAVQVTDTPWSQGDRLASYEILKDESSGAEKLFTVRLSLTKPDRVEEVQYHVLGQGPVMVFRDQDYQRNINMEDGPKLEKKTQKIQYRR